MDAIEFLKNLGIIAGGGGLGALGYKLISELIKALRRNSKLFKEAMKVVCKVIEEEEKEEKKKVDKKEKNP